MSDAASSTTPFEVVSHETRIAILRELTARQRTTPRDPFLSFSELRKRVGHRDPGNFNYHLGRLVGRFVVKDAEGYRLSYGGLMIAGAMMTGRYDRSDDMSLPSVDATCHACGKSATARYEEGLFRLECDSGHTFRIGVPATVIETQTGVDVIEFVSLVTQQWMEWTLRGVCPLCRSHMPSGIEPTDDGQYTYTFRATCGTCGLHISNTVGSCVVRHPAVVAFLYDHGEDVRTKPDWALDFCSEEATIRSEDPLRLEVAIRRSDEELRLTLTDDATVVDVERLNNTV